MTIWPFDLFWHGQRLARRAPQLIVNADDFGMSPGINQGIIEAHERGIVTSASLMMRGRAVEKAVVYARSHERLSVGLHVDLGEWKSGSDGWKPVYEVVPLDDRDAIVAEVRQQVLKFRAMLGRNPTHLDSHQHVHLEEPVRGVLMRAAEILQVPLRSCTPGIDYCGSFYGQVGGGRAAPEAITVDAMLNLLRGLTPGITELACHPAAFDDVRSAYATEREVELRVLCDPALKKAIDQHRIRLRSFTHLRLVKTPDSHQAVLRRAPPAVGRMWEALR